MKRRIPTLAAASFAVFATFAFAQGTPGSGPGMQGQAGRGEMREQMKGAYEACKDKPDRRACMTEQHCAKSADPAKCQTQAKERAQRGQQRLEQQQVMHEACNGKRGEDLTKCMQGQHQAKMNQHRDERQKAHEACNGKRGEELGKCLGEQRGKSGHEQHQKKS